VQVNTPKGALAWHPAHDAVRNGAIPTRLWPPPATDSSDAPMRLAEEMQFDILHEVDKPIRAEH
jgi:hypothetical protein